ncbi:MAG TPA: hypothetical protein VFK38_08475 [Candidatus Limnocylindrales bacterium]|nr:hypothetical protein [Candidatus Limnocylindrales bacterium]
MFGRGRDEDPPPDDPLAWRPQRPMPERVRGGVVQDPIVEPEWTGLRVLAHFDSERTWRGEPGWLHLRDEQGETADDRAPLAFAALRGAIAAVDAVIDGVLTDEATRSGVGASVARVPDIPRFQMIVPRPSTVDVRPVDGHDRGGLVAFVAVDLLRLDGRVLLDLPLLERKRLLEAVVVPGDLVRVTPFTRPPIAPWLATWKATGIPGIVLKGANSRYRPDTLNPDWRVIRSVRKAGL